MSLEPARTYPDRRDDVRLLIVDPALSGRRAIREARTTGLADYLRAGDLLIVNDAATVPASLAGHDEAGRPIEARLVAQRGDRRFAAVLFGAGDWHERTEDRLPPAEPALGTALRFQHLSARVVARDRHHARLVELELDVPSEGVWAALYASGRPVQYSHLRHELPLWAVQTVYATRPWAFEMPSAGRPLSWTVLLAMRRKGVRLAALTHAAGLSATGDPALDAALPLPERYEVPAATARAVAETRTRGGRVVAVGTTVVRALEGAAVSGGGEVQAGTGVTDLRITAGFRARIVAGVLSGMHAPSESHFQLLAAFAGNELLSAAAEHAEGAGFLTHELGDSMLVLPGALAAARAVSTASRPVGSVRARVSAA